MQLRSRKIAAISIFSASAVIIYAAETFIPKPLPWMRFGFGNIIVIICLYLLGFRSALVVTILKSTLGALIVGNLFSPSFIFSVSGGIASLAVMAFILKSVPRVFSPLGISVWGALTHNLVQLYIASLLFIGRIEVLHLFPIFIILSTITGTITGIITLLILRRTSKTFNFLISNHQYTQS